MVVPSPPQVVVVALTPPHLGVVAPTPTQVGVVAPRDQRESRFPRETEENKYFS